MKTTSSAEKKEKRSCIYLKKLFKGKKEKNNRSYFGTYNEIRSFECRMVFVISVIFLINIFRLYASHNSEKRISDISVANQAVNETKFGSMLREIINGVSAENDVRYTLDDHCCNEQDIIKYICIMEDIAPEYITENSIKKYFWDIFIPIESAKNILLIKKDNKMLVSDCADKEKMNKLDRAFMGIINNAVIKASKGFYISQNNDKFENIPYGTSNLKSSGCGPIALTMALNYVSDTGLVKLEEVLQWAEENNMYEINSGTRWSLIRNFPPAVSAKSEEMYITNTEELAGSIQAGEVLVTSMQKGQFTDSGHFIVITGIKDGKVSVLDPASICRSLKEWDIQTIYEESNKYFWKISK